MKANNQAPYIRAFDENPDSPYGALIGTHAQIQTLGHYIASAVKNSVDNVRTEEAFRESDVCLDSITQGDVLFDWIIVTNDQKQTYRLQQKWGEGAVDIVQNKELKGPIITCEFGWGEGLLIGTEEELLCLANDLTSVKVASEINGYEKVKINSISAESPIKLEHLFIVDENTDIEIFYYKILPEMVVA